MGSLPIYLKTLLIFTVFISACGGTGLDGGGGGGTYGGAKVIINRSRGLEKGRYAKVEKYLVKVSSPDMDEEITAEFDGGTKYGVVEGVPAGKDRHLEVTAVNPDGKTIRAGERGGITVYGGKVADVEVTMEAVPIFVNLKDGNTVPSTRLAFQIFSDPNDVVEVLDTTNQAPLFDIASGLNEITTDVSTGIGTMRPQGISPGEHVFRVLSKTTGRYSEVKVRVVDGMGGRPAPLYSAGYVREAGEYIGVMRVGSAFGGRETGTSWPEILAQLLKK